MLVNRRRTIRVNCDLMAVWTYPNVGSGSVLNISAEGLLLGGDCGARTGETLELAVLLDDVPVAFSALVCFAGETRRGRGHGVRIVDMAPADRYRWHQAYWQLVESAAARVPASIGHYLRRRATQP